MVTTLEYPGALQRQDVGRLFDHAKWRVGAGFVAADVATLLGREKPAISAGANLGGVFQHGLGDLPTPVVFLPSAADQPQGNALGAAGSDAGQTLELDNEALEGFGIVDSSHGRGDENRTTKSAGFPGGLRPKHPSFGKVCSWKTTRSPPPPPVDLPPPVHHERLSQPPPLELGARCNGRGNW